MALDIAVDQFHVRLLHPAAQPPARSRPGDAAYDLRCLEGLSLWPRERATLPNGVALALPPMVAGLVLPRSGLAAEHGISLVNAPGLIDPSYRGELRIVLVNHGDARFEARAGDRIAQLLLVPFLSPEIALVEELPPSSDGRGENGFGSSGR